MLWSLSYFVKGFRPRACCLGRLKRVKLNPPLMSVLVLIDSSFKGCRCCRGFPPSLGRAGVRCKIKIDCHDVMTRKRTGKRQTRDLVLSALGIGSHERGHLGCGEMGWGGCFRRHMRKGSFCTVLCDFRKFCCWVVYGLEPNRVHIEKGSSLGRQAGVCSDVGTMVRLMPVQ